MLTGRGGAPGGEANEKREIREISGGDAGNVRVGTTRSCTDDQDEDQEVRWALVGTKTRTKVVALYRRLRLSRRLHQRTSRATCYLLDQVVVGRAGTATVVISARLSAPSGGVVAWG